MKRFLCWVGIGVFALAIGCKGDGNGGSGGEAGSETRDFSDKAGEIGTRLATIDGMDVGTSDFDRLAKRMRPRAGEVTDEFKQDVMSEVVNETLLYQEALRQGIDRDPKIRKMMVNTLLKRDVYGPIDPNEITEDELRTYFEEHKDDFVVPEKVQIKRIVIKATADVSADDARAEAEELRSQIADNPTQFKALAQEHSQGPYARRGGDLGFVGRKGKPGVDQALIDAAFEMDKGDVSDVIETDDGFNVLYVPNKRDRVERTFEQMRGSVLRKVKSERYNAEYERYVGDLETKADVQIDEAALASYEYKVEQRGASVPGPLRTAPPGTVGGGTGDAKDADKASKER